ncbi:MAG: apolipoprotein N-acyltransferase [Thermoanaerobaculia bacterium]|nr:apolipoprotein N-acyltransferase [Thermoanaerobaculia bacterium]
MSKARGMWADLTIAVVGGLAWAACFQAEPYSLLPWIALTPLVALMGRPRAALWGALWGLVAWLAMVHWIAPTIQTFGGLSPWLSWMLVVLLAVVLGFEGALLAWLGARCWRRSDLWPIFVLPSIWVLLELVRGFFANGFPWNLAAYAWIDVPGALALSSWIGAWGVSWCVVAANVALTLGALRGHWKTSAAAVLSLGILLILAGRFAVLDMPRAGGREVSVFQPGSEITYDPGQLSQDYFDLIEMSEAECGLGPRLLVWPESAAFPHSWHGSPLLRRDVERFATRGCPVLFGSPVPAGESEIGESWGGVHNAALIVGPDGVEGLYAKRRLVPFGEYVPFETLLPFVGKLARESGRFVAGEEPGLLPWAGERLGVAICYEVVFAGAVAEQVREGATLLVTITNDAWYGDTSAPWQHLRAVRFRAAENRRPMLRAALTGVSVLVDARGRVTSELDLDESGVLRGRVRGTRELSPYSRAPSASLWVCFLVAAIGIGRFGIIRPRRSRREGVSNTAPRR